MRWSVPSPRGRGWTSCSSIPPMLAVCRSPGGVCTTTARFPEKESKQLLKFCELKWSPESLQFYNRTNIMSKTSSQSQIRNPIYKKNANDFLNYQEFLKPFGKKYHWFN